MTSVFDQLSWNADSNSELLGLVSSQVDAQEQLRRRVRSQLAKHYPKTAYAWISSVSWSAPQVLPLASFDIAQIREWTRWEDDKAIKECIEQIEEGSHTPIVSVKLPGARCLHAAEGRSRLSAYLQLGSPVPTWVGRAHRANGDWERMRYQILDRSEPSEVELSDEVSDEAYEQILAARRKARSVFPAGDSRRIAAERDVRKARKARNLATEEDESEATVTVTQQLELASHEALLAVRRRAQSEYPPGHPIRVEAERNVRRSRTLTRADRKEVSDSVVLSLPNPAGKLVTGLLDAETG